MNCIVRHCTMFLLTAVMLCFADINRMYTIIHKFHYPIQLAAIECNKWEQVYELLFVLPMEDRSDEKRCGLFCVIIVKLDSTAHAPKFMIMTHRIS